MEPGPDLEEAAHPAVEGGLARGRLSDPREDLQERALAGTVAPDDPDDLARPDLEADVLQGPELLGLARCAAAPASQGGGRQAPQALPQRAVARGVPVLGDAVALAEVFNADRRVHDSNHQKPENRARAALR